ncbi:MAG TPA: cupin domain-containing protein [Arenimonas sp.]|uniref:cupin domain-containing protein n=1 Tax=Arenimonas sp. TaxID=1872635 RepID=UPI002D7FA5C3|nr:cupin domain-containing protein [Arenimonas sp.]HEU0152952.1 cupin domain-containing protein [Arenimonas sp.]
MAKKILPSYPIEVTGSPELPLGMAPEVFLRDYWQKRPLLVRAAFPGFVSPISPEDLAGLACEEAALARVVLHDRKRDRWELRTGPFSEESFPKLPKQDWTLLVQDVDKWDMDIRALLDAFRFLPAWRLDDVMVSFAAPGGSVGAHVDQYDVFLLQAQGHRRWQIDARPGAPRDFRPDVELKLLSRFTPDHDWVLAPGDMLYLPPGVPHHGVAEDACLTFSVGMRAPSQAELMVDLAEELAAALPEEARYADPDLALPADPWEIDEAAFGRVRAALRDLQTLDEAALRRWFGRFITQYRAAGELGRPARPPRLDAIETELAAGARLLRHPHARHAWARNGKRACLHANGLSLPMGVAAARRLARADALEAADLAALDASGREAVESLVAAGHYQLVKPKRRR